MIYWNTPAMSSLPGVITRPFQTCDRRKLTKGSQANPVITLLLRGFCAQESSMNRKQFIEQQGATCRNWNWSWSFVNHEERFVIFGAWDVHDEAGRGLIF